MEKYTVEVFDNGTRKWYSDGLYHRVDGPAVEYAHGSKLWYVNDKLHRVDGPAIEYADGSKEWWIDGVKYTEREFIALTTKVVSSLDGKCIVIDGLEYRLVLVK